MDLEHTDEQLELRATARAVLDRACPPALVRSFHEGSGDADELWRVLVELDWPALGVPAEHGGLGLGFVEVGILVEELGRAAAPGPFLATVTHLAPVLREAGAGQVLAALAAGRVTGTLAVAERGAWRPRQVATTARRAAGGWVVDGEKSHVLDGATAAEIAVVARAPEGTGVFLVAGDEATATAPEVVDPTLPTATVRVTEVAVDGPRVLVEPGDPAAERVIERALEEATTALALSTVATCRTIFEMTLQHAKDRAQFGRPIGSFQAVKHRLADAYLAVERAAAISWFAALTIAEDDPRRSVAAAMAKAAAGDCQRLLARDGLQLHGGIGFTWEHDLHLFLKRAKAGDLLLGSAAGQRVLLARLLGLEPAA
jgi:alkylation response protein AidB-like acyl-CoA dehydrogenase